MNNKLKPCPFCGSDDVHIEKVDKRYIEHLEQEAEYYLEYFRRNEQG